MLLFPHLLQGQCWALAAALKTAGLGSPEPFSHSSRHQLELDWENLHASLGVNAPLSRLETSPWTLLQTGSESSAVYLKSPTVVPKPPPDMTCCRWYLCR